MNDVCSAAVLFNIIINNLRFKGYYFNCYFLFRFTKYNPYCFNTPKYTNQQREKAAVRSIDAPVAAMFPQLN